MTGRRRPRASAPRAFRPASETLDLRLVRTPGRAPGIGAFTGQMLGAILRRATVAPHWVEIVDRETGRAIAAEPVDGGADEARGVMTLMRADLESLPEPAFVKRWGRARL